jgi:S-formylglutathione hydrolase FrmB
LERRTAAMTLRTISIVDLPFRGALAFAGLGLLGSSWLLRNWVLRWSMRMGALMLAVAFVGATINAHYDYFPTLGALLGRRAADQVSASEFQQLAGDGSLPTHGVVLAFRMPGTVSGFPARTGQVYLPPAWFQLPHPRLPVIELLHGSPGSPADWTRGGMADLAADRYARTHGGFAPMLVMPDVNGHDWWHDSECVNGPQGNAETYLTVDVRRAVVNAFDARADGESWGIAGLSEGGSCSLQIGLRHPSEFAAVGDFSGGDHPWAHGGLRRLFWGNTPEALAAAERTYDPRVLLAHLRRRTVPAINFSVGRSDGDRPKMTGLLDLARRAHIDAELKLYRGGHTFRLWRESFSGALPWLVRHLDDGTPGLLSQRG